MKNSTKRNLVAVILLTVNFFGVNGQTNVSGGIYANTTWTLANSPYIITDTVVVFPNVTLTIQPGVTVRFANNKRIEIRQAKLIAVGTAADSITFTSNTPSPTAGIYSGIYLNGGYLTSKFNYCNFSYASTGIYATNSDTLIINNSNFNQNLSGLRFLGNSGITEVAIIVSGIFRNNTDEGVAFYSLYSSAIDSCYFLYNGDGLKGGFFNTNKSITRNCIFNFNQTGLNSIQYMLVENCTIMNNQTGIISASMNKIQNCNINSNSIIGVITSGDSLFKCKIKYNGAGIKTKSSVIIGNDIEYNIGTSIKDNATWVGTESIITGNTIRFSNIGIDNSMGYFGITKNTIENNNVGIKINNSGSTISCNTICGNTTYGLQNETSSNINAGNNYWCTPDSVSTEVIIYDGYDNINYGLVNFMPIDTSQCYLTIGIPIYKVQTFSFSIFPNPATDYLTVELPANNSKTEIKIFNMLDELAYSSKGTSQKTKIDVSAFSKGVHIIQVSAGDNHNSRQKFFKQ